jgi:hypothetical protein
MFLITLLANETSKDQSQDDAGIMTVKGTGAVVQVASSDMSVAPDGSLVPRNGSGVLRTAPKMTEHALSSRVPDKFLAELSSFMYTDPKNGNAVSVRVNSFVRVPEFGALCGSVVILQTTLGPTNALRWIRVEFD